MLTALHMKIHVIMYMICRLTGWHICLMADVLSGTYYLSFGQFPRPNHLQG